MTFLKNLAIILFCLLLFLSLTVFGLAFTVKSTVLNPDFVTGELNRLEISALVKENVPIENQPELPNLNETINQAVSKLEPELKKQSTSAINSVYDYLLGKKPEPDLRSTLRTTFLSADFVTSLVNSVDVSPFIAGAISQQIAQEIPIEIPNLDRYISEAVASAEPVLKQQVIAISGPVFDYLLGISPTLKTSISLAPALENLRGTLRQAFINSPPPGFEIGGMPISAIPRELRAAAFDQLYQEFIRGIPTTYPIDETIIDAQLRADIAQGIADAEDNLRQARQYVARFQQVYAMLLAFIALTALGIILLVRNVKKISLYLSIPTLISGAVLYAGTLVIKNIISTKLDLSEIPPRLEPWLLQLIDDAIKPLEIFSLVILFIGAALVVTLFVYKRKQT
ncbi:MAG: hypothetical protein HYX80_03130 [Chloroflexi bacterium]|nr:hypothetical protein [Chloroflexota bacterium]